MKWLLQENSIEKVSGGGMLNVKAPKYKRDRWTKPAIGTSIIHYLKPKETAFDGTRRRVVSSALSFHTTPKSRTETTETQLNSTELHQHNTTQHCTEEIYIL